MVLLVTRYGSKAVVIVSPRFARSLIPPAFISGVVPKQQHSTKLTLASTHCATTSPRPQRSYSTLSKQAIMGKSNPVTMVEEYVLGNEGTPFYTREVCTDRPPETR